MLYDTHTHPYMTKRKSPKENLERFFWGEWKYLNSIWVDIDSSQKSVILAKEYSGIKAVIGIHPCDILQYKDSLLENISRLRNMYEDDPKLIVAIGESGLDYHWLESMSESSGIEKDKIISLQKDFFRAHISLARELRLPLVIHNRNAAEDVLSILMEEGFKNFVFHCYSEDYSYAQRLLNFAPECKLWFWGVVTFKNAKEVQEVVSKVPLHNIIIETDAPYLTPVPYRWKEENEPLFVQHVLSHIIDLREEDSETIKKQVFENSCVFFQIKKEG